MPVPKQQHSIMLTAEQSEQLHRLAAESGRRFNEQVRITIDEGLRFRARPVPVASRDVREVMVQLYDDVPRCYRNAECEYDEANNRITVRRGQRTIAFFDASRVEHWSSGETAGE